MIRNVLTVGLVTFALAGCSEQPGTSITAPPTQVTAEDTSNNGKDAALPSPCLLAKFKVSSGDDINVECNTSDGRVSLSANGAVFRFPVVDLDLDSTWNFDEASGDRLSTKVNDFTTIFALPENFVDHCLIVSAVATDGVSDSVFFMDDVSIDPVRKNLKIDASGDAQDNKISLSDLVSKQSRYLMIFPRETKTSPRSIRLSNCLLD